MAITMYSNYIISYIIWSSIDPESCRCEAHFKYVWNRSIREMEEEDLPDEEVCNRERAWRRYVKNRDEHLGFS